MTVEASSEYRAPHLPASNPDEAVGDLPVLAPLIAQQCSGLEFYTRSSPHFYSVNKGWNLQNRSQALAVARCSSILAVQSVVAFCSGTRSQEDATSNRPPLVVRSGGHDSFGRSVVGDSLMLDVRGLDTITISSDRTTATVGGGVTSGNLTKFLNEHDLITPSGYCNTVGYTGWATGGGYGVLAGAYGLGVDQILGATLVDATGHMIDTDDDPDLLWAIRGAGTGNFGIVVSLRVRVYDCPPFLGGLLLFPASETDGLMIGLKKVIEEIGNPEEFSGDCSVTQLPGVGAVFGILFAWVGRAGDGGESLRRGQECLAKCEKLGTVLVNTVSETTPSDMMATLEPLNSEPKVAKLKTCTVSGLGEELASILSRNPVPTAASMIIAHRSHGAATFPHPTRQSDPVTRHSCMPNREPHTVLFVAGGAVIGEDGVSTKPGEYEMVAEWAERTSSQISKAGITLPRTYVSWTANEEADAVQLYGKDITDRLRTIKQRYDGGNVFASAYPNLA